MAEEGPGDANYHEGAHAEPHEAEKEAVRLRGQNKDTIQNEPGVESETTLVRCGTTKGPFVARLHRDWSPQGYDRAKALFQRGYYDGSHFFRVVPNFLVQFGISYTEDRALQQFANSPIPDDPQLDPPKGFHAGTMSYAGSGPNSRTSQLFISYGSNPGLGKELWETPFGEVIEGMENVANLYSYGDMPPWGKGPLQNKIRQDPNYIPNEFPMLDKFTTCTAQVESPERHPSADEQVEGVAAAAAAAEEEEQEAAKDKEEEGGKTDDAAGGGGGADDAELQDMRRPKAVESLKNLKGAVTGFDPKSIMKIAEMEVNEMMQVGAVVSGIIVLTLVAVSMSRRKKKKKKHKN